MKNVWFIFIGMLVVFMLFFVSFFDFKNNNLGDKVTQDLVQTKVNNNQKEINLLKQKTKPNLTKRTTRNGIQKIAESEDEQIYKEEIAEIYPDENKVKPIQNNT